MLHRAAGNDLGQRGEGLGVSRRRRWSHRGRLAVFVAATLAVFVLIGSYVTTRSNPGEQAEVSPACDKTQTASALNCSAAVAAARRALPTGHPPIVSIEFHYGRYAGLTAGCVGFGDEGYVVFKTSDPSGDLWVTVVSRGGEITLTGGVGHYPPAAVCQPSS